MMRAGRYYARGEAFGRALLLSEPLSFYGGVDSATGDIVDHSHPQRGENVTGRILIMPGARGSSSSSAVLAEAIRRKTAPVGIILGRPDPILTVGCLVAQAVYDIYCPLVVCAFEEVSITNAHYVRITQGMNAGAFI